MLGKASGLGAQAFENMSIGQRLAASMQHGTLGAGLMTGAMHGFKNIGLATMMGTMTGIGMGQGQKVLGRIAPMSTPSRIMEGVALKAGRQFEAQQMQEAGQLVPVALSHIGLMLSGSRAGVVHDFSHVKNSAGVPFKGVDWLTSGPGGGPDFEAASDYRHKVIRATARPEEFAQGATDHASLDPGVAKNKHFAESYSAGVREQFTGLGDPEKTRDLGTVRFLQNQKNTLEANAHQHS